jgi:two-component system phosphate regulon response regulator PhoB
MCRCHISGPPTPSWRLPAAVTTPPVEVRILVLGDEPATRDGLVRGLAEKGWRVEAAPTGPAGLEVVRRGRPDLILLDVPETGGEELELLVRARRHTPTPIVVLVERADSVALLFAMAFGAADYVSKPTSAEAVAARIHPLLPLDGLATPPVRDRLVFPGLTVDRASREVFVRGALVETTAREFDLLALLAASPRRVFSRAELLELVWGSSMRWQRPTTVTEHVRRLRAKIEADPRRPRWVVTVRGVGYRFEPG